MTKDEIQAKLQEHLTSLQADLDVLQAKAGDATDDLKVELDEQIANLKIKFSEAEVKFDQIKDATEEALSGLIAEAEGLWNTVSTEVMEEVEEHISSPTGLLAKIKALFS
ncbi:hypothetical protein [Crenothrix polyspora]|jgi:predicted  nucleic acid-binding Zn-ribbon protein|uniref:Uncharacterized protein n=1 Tax=Crenothrix polyspora TaxID=360316 RepID=A0A1R4H6A3_9GAMM|nr:hypothetical protein [Crenothrix polyspora]SJM91390.1 conserved hypothetical protein [Crenothrix polyspora]